MRGLLVLAAAVCALAGGTAAGGGEERTGLQARADASIWYGRGEASFQSPNLDPFISSDLVYPFRGTVGEVRGEVSLRFPIGSLLARAGVRGRLAGDIDLTGTATDSDWSFGERFGYSEHDCRTGLLIWDIDAVFAVFPFEGLESPIFRSIETGVFAGYGEEKYKFTVRDGWGDYSGEFYYFEGKVSTYDADFTGLRTGIFLRAEPLPRLSLDLEAVFIPGLRAEGDGHWILRDYRFHQKAEGSGAALSGRIAYELTGWCRVFAALRRVVLTADRNGRESGEEAGGESYSDEEIVGWIKSRYTGYELGVSLIY
ncbi:MAG: hypothetical protein P9M08_06650 [Candidatus Erginobacter occultus]|nr:hypothetical protein [Candidatus Erginobacter occultus]